jgi:LysW-gamma-L-lysine carboxypeptidase
MDCLKAEIELLKGALEHYSPTSNTKEMGEFLIDWATQNNMETKFQNEMVVINPQAKTLMMLGHMDTVPPELPVEIDEKKGLLTGRGSVDAKGPLCAALAALEKLPQLWDKVCIVAAPDEEGRSLAAKNIRDEWQERPCIILEPSTWRGITLSYMGRLAINCKVTCPQTHPGHLKPFAAEEVFKVWYELSKDQIVRIRNIAGKDTEAVMNLDLRFREGDPEDIISKIPENVEFKITERTLPYTANKNTKLTRAFLRAVREVGGTPVFKKKTGTSDMNVLGEKWTSAPMMAYGPGDGNLGHTQNEYIELDDYLKGVDVLKKALVYIFS